MSNKFHKIKLLDIFLRIAELEKIPIQEKDGYPKTGMMADLLGVSKQSVSNWKQRQTIPWEEILEYASNNVGKFNIYWLLLGEKIEPSPCDVGCEEWEKELGKMAIKVLESKTEADYSGSLNRNIKSFYAAVIAEEEKKGKEIKSEKRIKKLENQVKDLQNELLNLKKTNSNGRESDTPEKPAKSTG